MNKIIRKLSNSSYGTAKLFGLIKLIIEAFFKKKQPVLIYSMGKVGTTSIHHLLKKNLPQYPVYHLHTLRQDRIKNEAMVYRKNFSRIHTIHDHLLNSMFLRQQLKFKKINTNKWKITTLVRDPIARNISAFFQTLNLHSIDNNFYNRIQSGGDKNLINDMKDYFINKLDHNNVLKWFDREIKTVFGIDVLEYEFPYDKGFKIYYGKNADLLLIRLEDLDKCASQAFSEFLDVGNIELEKKQNSNSKYYSTTYKTFKDTVSLPEPFLDSLYFSVFTKNFYSEEEISKFREQWHK